VKHIYVHSNFFLGETCSNFVHCSAEEFAELGKFRPNRKKFARNFWGET
jgi:hypothetical protein